MEIKKAVPKTEDEFGAGRGGRGGFAQSPRGRGRGGRGGGEYGNILSLVDVVALLVIFLR